LVTRKNTGVAGRRRGQRTSLIAKMITHSVRLIGTKEQKTRNQSLTVFSSSTVTFFLRHEITQILRVTY